MITEEYIKQELQKSELAETVTLPIKQWRQVLWSYERLLAKMRNWENRINDCLNDIKKELK